MINLPRLACMHDDALVRAAVTAMYTPIDNVLRKNGLSSRKLRGAANKANPFVLHCSGPLHKSALGTRIIRVCESWVCIGVNSGECMPHLVMSRVALSTASRRPPGKYEETTCPKHAPPQSACHSTLFLRSAETAC